MNTIEKLKRIMAQTAEEIKKEEQALQLETQKKENDKRIAEAMEKQRVEDLENLDSLKPMYETITNFLGTEATPMTVWLFCAILTNKSQLLITPQGYSVGGQPILYDRDLYLTLETIKRGLEAQE